MDVGDMNVWNYGLLAIGAFVATTGLVRLMRRRRDQVLAELTAEAREAQERKQLAGLLEKRKQKKQRAA